MTQTRILLYKCNAVVMNRTEHMDPSVMWLLFMMTCLVHIFTFFILQTVADKFSVYIVRPDITLVKGVSQRVESNNIKKKIEASNDQNETHLQFIGPTNQVKASSSALRVNDYNRGQYQQLHETLDVSVFR